MRIGEILVERGLVTEEQVEEALAQQGDRRLGAALVAMGHVALDEVSRALAQQQGIPSLRLEYFKNADPDAVRALDPTLAARYFAAAVGFKSDEDGNRRLVVAMRDPDDATVQAISECTGHHVVPCIVTEFLLTRVIEKFYAVQPKLELAVMKPDEPAGGQTMAAAGAATSGRPGAEGSESGPDQPAAEIVYGICVEHPERKTVFVCPNQECRGEWCLDCSDHRWTPHGFADHCDRCGEPLVDTRKRRTGSRRSRGGRAAGAGAAAGGTAVTSSLFERLPELARFPFTSSGLTLLIGLTVISTVLGAVQIFFSTMMIGYAARLIYFFVWGFELTVFFGILTATADGKNEITIDDVIRLDESVYAPIKRFGAAHVPLIIALVWWAFSLVDESVFDALLDGDIRVGALLGQLGPPTIAVLLAIGLLPILTIVAAVTSSVWSVLNPNRWWEILRTLGASYAAGAFLFYLVFLVERVVLQLLINELGTILDSEVLVLPFARFPTYILFAIRMRILGGLLQPHRDELLDPA